MGVEGLMSEETQEDEDWTEDEDWAEEEDDELLDEVEDEEE